MEELAGPDSSFDMIGHDVGDGVAGKSGEAQDGSVRGRFVVQAYDQDSFIDLEHSKGFTLYGVVDADNYGYSVPRMLGADRDAFVANFSDSPASKAS